MIYGLVAPGYTMARTVVSDLADEQASFTGADMSTKLKLMGVDVASIGDAHAKSQGALIYTYQNGASEVYKRLVVSQDPEKLLGAVLVGEVSGYGTLLQYCLNGIDLPENPESAHPCRTGPTNPWALGRMPCQCRRKSAPVTMSAKAQSAKPLRRAAPQSMNLRQRRRLAPDAAVVQPY